MLYLSLISKTIERSVHFQGKPFNTTVIQVYATTTVAKGADIDQRQNTDFGTINLMRGVQAYMSIFLSLDTSSSHNCPMQHFSLATPSSLYHLLIQSFLLHPFLLVNILVHLIQYLLSSLCVQCLEHCVAVSVPHKDDTGRNHFMEEVVLCSKLMK